MKKYSLAALVIFTIAACFLSSCTPETIDDEKKISSTLFLESEYKTICNGESKIFKRIQIIDRGQGVGTMTWTADKTYILEGLVYVNKGQTLTIEPGTVVKGEVGQGKMASALIIAKGGKIIAEGTEELPIIFTSKEDVIYSSEDGICDESAFTENSRGLWGGIIMLGDAPIGRATEEYPLELLFPEYERALYGGQIVNANSGSLKYVSIRHTGTQLESGLHTAGLVMAGVGSETIIENVEVYASEDDGFRWIGGTVDSKYLVAAYCGNDAMDYSEGWIAKNQFWLAYQGPNSDHGLEGKGNSDCRDCNPLSIPLIVNATFIGNGHNRAGTFQANAGGKIFNSIFQDYSSGFEIEFLDKDNDSYSQFKLGNITFRGNIFSETESETVELVNETKLDINDKQSDLNKFINNNNFIGDPGLIDLRPMPGSPARQPGDQISDLIEVDYKGAFEPDADLWFKNWTKLGKHF